MFAWAWYEALSADAKSIVVAIAGAAAGAVVGGLIKWLFDRAKIRNLKNLVTEVGRDRETAREQLMAAVAQREIAFKEQKETILELAKREAESSERQRKLDELERIIDGRAIDVTAQRTQLNLLLQRLRGTEAGIWTTFEPECPDSWPVFGGAAPKEIKDGPIVLVVANNKGGVGKTTLVGNLLAYFDRRMRRGILAIDLDYQGSLSTMLRAEISERRDRRSDVNDLLERGAGEGALFTAMSPLGLRLMRSHLVPAFYELALLEDRLMVEWLLQESDDVRYRLANLLRLDSVKGKFDLVIIDVPPRLSTGTINALCAATHVLVPTMFNPIAAEPVANFIGTAKGLMQRLNPAIKFIGVVETMAPPAREGRDARAEGRRVIQEALNRSFPEIGILDNNVPRRTAIADGGVAFLDDNEAREIFTGLGNEVLERLV